MIWFPRFRLITSSVSVDTGSEDETYGLPRLPPTTSEDEEDSDPPYMETMKNYASSSEDVYQHDDTHFEIPSTRASI